MHIREKHLRISLGGDRQKLGYIGLLQMTFGAKMLKTIAVIDDEVEMGDLYSMIFERQILKGLVKVEFFSDSRDFVEWYKTNTPDLILSDIDMPHLNGPQVMKLIQQSEQRIPAYFVSGHHPSEYTHVMRELGVYRFISKPMNFNLVQGLIELDLGILSANL